jgi:hypothetical protein
MTGHPEEHALPTAERNTAMPEQPDEQHGDEPTVAHYQRADADKMPTHPAGQQAAVEGMLAAEGWTSGELIRRARRAKAAKSGVFGQIADELNRRGVPTDTPAGRLAADMFALFERFEQERRAEIRAAGGNRDEADAQPLDPGYLRWIADEYERNDATSRERLLDLLGDDLDLDDIRILRLAGEAAVAATPRAIKAARGRGMEPPQIAAELGLTPSRIYQVLRDYVQYEWRLDLYDSEQGPGWQPYEAGTDLAERRKLNAAQLADRVFERAGKGPRQHRARVLVWEDRAGDDNDALFVADRTPDGDQDGDQ